MKTAMERQVGASETPEPAALPLAGHHAIVTGASRGIGSAIAVELARLGAKLTLAARHAGPLKALVDTLAPGRAIAHAADVTDPDAIACLFAAAAAQFGPATILVNNAGGAESAPFGRTDPELWHRTINLNLTSVYLCSRAALPGMLAAKRGRIISVASTAGLTGYAYVSAYVAAKHGVVGLTRALALELAKTGVTVNAVCPGYTDTPMVEAAIANIAAKTGRPADQARAELAKINPMGRLVTPEEVATVVGWLALPTASAITGQAIPIAGGEVM